MITPAAKYVNSDDFLASHSTLYSHDRIRYPMYYDPCLIRELVKIQPVHTIQTSSTNTIIDGLQNWVVKPANTNDSSEDQVKRIVEETLKQRQQEAVTGALFAPHTKNNFEISLIRRKISLEYTSHYMTECAADILTGIPSLGFYDSLAINFPYFDTELFGTFLKLAGINLHTEVKYRKAIDEVVLNINSPIHSLFLIRWKRLITEIVGEHILALTTPSNKANLQGHALSKLRQKCVLINPKKTNIFTIEYLTDYLKLILAPHSESQPSMLPKVVFVVSTDTESDAITRCLKLKGIDLLPQTLPRLSAWRGLEFNGFEIWVVRTEMASSGQSGSHLTTVDVIGQLSPKYMIMPGIAFGLKPDKQHIGDILVAKSITDYETSKITTSGIIPRGEKPNASSELLSKARMAVSLSRTSQVHIGEILSGLKLVNDLDFINQLKTYYPEALGGEMEGSGFAAACERYQVSWLLVKGICDWGISKSDDSQLKAAINAATYCLQIVELLPRSSVQIYH